MPQYLIALVYVPNVDAAGDPCKWCEQEKPHPIQAQFYHVRDGERIMDETCLRCLTDVIRQRADADQRVVVEVMEHARGVTFL